MGVDDDINRAEIDPGDIDREATYEKIESTERCGEHSARGAREFT